MLNPSDLTDAEITAYYRALRRPHDAEVVVQVMTVDFGFLGEVKAVGGQVDGTAEESVVRKCGLTVLDPEGYFDGPSMDLMVQVIYRVQVPDLRTQTVVGPGGGEDILPVTIPFTLGPDPGAVSTVGVSVPAEVPVFTGPIVRPPTRNGDEVTLECQDRAAIAMRGRSPKQWSGRPKVTDVIQNILKECGETRFAGFEGINAKIEDPVNIGWDEKILPWTQAQKLANSIDRHLFYTAAGVCKLRTFPETTTPLRNLTKHVTSQGQPEPLSEIINRVHVKGKRPNAGQVAVETLPPSNPLSPESLKVHGQKQFFTFEESGDKLNTKAKVNARAKRLIKQYENKQIETATYNIVPVPTLDPYDTLTIDKDVLTVLTWSFPLVTGSDMTLGYHRPLPTG